MASGQTGWLSMLRAGSALAASSTCGVRQGRGRAVQALKALQRADPRPPEGWGALPSVAILGGVSLVNGFLFRWSPPFT